MLPPMPTPDLSLKPLVRAQNVVDKNILEPRARDVLTFAWLTQGRGEGTSEKVHERRGSGKVAGP